MSYVIGIDLGTGSVKALLVDRSGQVRGEASESYPLIHERSGWSEQDPEQWVTQSLTVLRRVISESGIRGDEVEGISFSGQMHGLVLLDEQHKVIRPAILWNDTRTTIQCRQIEEKLGDQLIAVAKNRALEGFTLPKLLWVKEHEPDNFSNTSVFLLPKDYLRFRLTGELGMDYSDAAGTIMLDVAGRKWSKEILQAFDLDASLCPPLLDSGDLAGTLLPEIAEAIGCPASVKVFAGGADNACGAIGSGILSPGGAMCSIGTSGVVLSYESDGSVDYEGRLHFFNHGQRDAFYSMGVTLAAGYSLTWFKEVFAPEQEFASLLKGLDSLPAGAGGLLFSPYIVGERTPYPDASIRGSFIGLDASHTLEHCAKAVVEGITFSLRDSIELMRGAGKTINRIVSIGGGAKNEAWLQIQADIFGAEIVQLESEQGPALGAAMLAAVGCGWYDSLELCAEAMVRPAGSWKPRPAEVSQYNELYSIYQEIYASTRAMNEKLAAHRK